VVSIARVTESVLSVDNFNKPKQLTDYEAVGTFIMRIILQEKGSIQCHPDMGVGIRSRYRYASSDKLSDLKYDIKSQIETYLPNFQVVDVTTTLNNKKLDIEVESDSTLFRFRYDYTTDDMFKLSEI
jgi:hypothetical protein